MSIRWACPTAANPKPRPPYACSIERARSVSPGWGSGPQDADAVAAICVRLAGIPLAIELAAARCRLLDPLELHDRLDTALLDGARDLPERQRTMRATLDWSYGLLGEGEQALLRLLAVFVGGFRLDDLEQVAARAGRADGVLPGLEVLAEQSLVVGAATASGRRYRLLEPIAQYARARLDEAGEWEAVSRAHADHFVALAEENGPALPRQRAGRRPRPDRRRAPEPHGGDRAQPGRR